MKDALKHLREANNILRQDDGTYVASLGEYYVNFCWIRDIYYQALPELTNDHEKYKQTYRRLLDYMHKLENEYDHKISWLIKQPRPLKINNGENCRFIHPRFNKDLTEIDTPWGNIQLDAIGYFLMGIAQGHIEGIDIIRNREDMEIIQLIIDMLEAIQYHTVKDNGAWEENEEIHASSVGAVVGALKKLQLTQLDLDIDQSLIDKGQRVLDDLLPNESETKMVDLALLSLIYPFEVTNQYQTNKILQNIEKYLVRDRGVIRYIGDRYYNIAAMRGDNRFDMQFIGNELEWTFGFAYLSIIYSNMGILDKSECYLNKILEVVDKKTYYIPEGYYSKTDEPGVNNPLGWAVAMTIIAIEKILKER